MMSITAPPLSLYIHFPWCTKKCPYCDFNSHMVEQNMPEEDYIKALVCDLDNSLASLDGRSIISIFMGGGTPSLFSAQSLDYLLTNINKRCRLDKDLEITLEANPDSLEVQKFRDYRLIGINRLSLGIQSFNDISLQKIGRIHNADVSKHAIDVAYHAGFDNVNLDLMYGLPDQTPESALSDLKTALDYRPAHISWYQLTIEPNTIFYSKPPQLPEHDSIYDVEKNGQILLDRAGFECYEISAYAKPQRQCVHNKNYWHFGDYLGLGAGAHSKITYVSDNRIERSVRYKQPKQYMQAKFISKQYDLVEKELSLEFMMNALRLTQGTPKTLFNQHTGLLLADIMPTIQQAIQLGWMIIDDDNIRASAKGLHYLNDVLDLFMP